VDNVTHTFVGAAMAECAMPRDASSRTRVVFISAGVLAANAPDVDLLYTGITETPLGYLLHHRGHSHTLPGLAALGIVIWSGLRIFPRVKADVRGAESRWILLVAAALLGHLLMDTANGYGTHLFYPFSARWVYGDAVFVLEPWLWAILGAGLGLTVGRYWRVLVALLTLVPISALVYVGLLQLSVLAVLLGVVGASAIVARAWDRQRRAAIALLATAAMFLLMSGVSRVAKAEALRAVQGLDTGHLVDIVADANPGVPWCWAVLTLQNGPDGPAESLTARRATLSLLPGVWPAASCASARLSTHWADAPEAAASDAIVWHRRWRIDVGELRALAARNCRVRAWLQFGRVPHVADGRIADLRFEQPIGQNFTPMAVDTGSPACPTFLTDWEWPRRDVLEPSFGSR
jgi:inner membrane protein